MGAQSTLIDDTVLTGTTPDAGAAPPASAGEIGLAAPGRCAKDDCRPVPADQAVFTSVRSAVAVGYRIIAASTGLSRLERQEITQHCPSHASLADDGPAAEALYTWILRTGRYAVAWSRHAGVEHTGRGGYRVHTHVAVLSGPEYRRFSFHPIRVYSAMLEALGDEPLLETKPVLEPLALPDPTSTEHEWSSAMGIGCNREAVFAMLQASLAGETTIVTGLDSPLAAIDAVLAILPLSLRPAAGISIGLKYSPARPAPLTVLEGDSEEARRLTRGQRVGWLDAGAPAPPPESPGETAVRKASQNGLHWLSLARQWWADGRRGDLCRLAARVDFKTGPADLDRIATLCQDADAAAAGDTVTLHDLAARYAAFKPANKLEADLVESVREALSARRAI
jgi:hypothetical protein